jgi:hypothetical protein
MSVTFTSNATEFKTVTDVSPCLCAQMAESFLAAMAGDFSDAVKAELRAEASLECPCCKGTGIERNELDDRPSVNWNNGNAQAILAALGVPFEYGGEMTIADARRAVMRARARTDLTPFTRPEKVVYGRPRVNEDGSVELRPLRMFGGGLDTESVHRHIEQFARFVEESASRGATTITWS